MLWSVGNTLRVILEAHEAAQDQGRINDELPAKIAAALKDLTDTHGLFQMGIPGMAQVFEAIREAARGPDTPDLRSHVTELTESLTPALEADAQSFFDALNTALGGDGQAAKMAWGMARDSLLSALSYVGRSLWTASKGGGTVVLSHDLIVFLQGNRTLIGQFYAYVTGNTPAWIAYVIQYAISLLA